MTSNDPKPQGMAEPGMIKLIKNTENLKAEVKPNEVGTPVSVNSPSKPGRFVSIVNVGEELDKPYYPQLEKRMDELHARNNRNEPYTCCGACCGVTTGWHCCLSTSRKSDVDKFGVGIVLYFRFIKLMAIFFLLASVLSIPSLYFAIEAAKGATTDTLTDYKNVLSYTTLGSLARGVTECYDSQINTSPTMAFSCEKGTIGKFSTLTYGRITEETALSCERFTAYSYETKCFNTIAMEAVYSNCENQPSCDFTADSTFFDTSTSECNDYWGQHPNPRVYFETLCQNIKFKLADGTPISKQKAGWIIASLDTAIGVLYLLFLLLLKNYEKEAVLNVEGNTDSIENYTIQVKRFPRMTRQQLKGKLWNHFNSIKVKGKQLSVNVVDVQLAESNTLLRLNSELGTLREKKVKEFRRFFKKWSDGNNSPLPETTYDDLKGIANQKGKKALKEFRVIEKIRIKQEKLQDKINKLKTTKKSEVVSAFVTFEDKKQRNLVFTHLKKSPLSSCCFSICSCAYKNDPNVFEGKYLHISEAPTPGNIIWANMSAGKFNKFLRRLLSWVITIALWIISFTFMAYVKDQQQEIALRVKPSKDCSDTPNPTSTEVITDQSLGDNSIGLLECYCRADISRALNDNICRGWTLDRLWSNALPFLIVMVIIFINFVLQYVFKLLSSFERHRSASSESVSRIFKIFVAQALNTGIIILIVNIKFSRNPVGFLDGNYDDVSVEWYLDVGITLLITLLINIVNLPVINFVFQVIVGILRCFDRSCTFEKEKTRKKSQTAWEKLYTGPEFLIEFRYSQILTVIFISLLYSSGIPLLYISTFLNLIVFYWLDKIFLLKISRLPPKLDEKLHALVRKTLVFATFLHLGKAIWVYGNTKIFGDTDALNQANEILQKLTSGETPGIFAKLIERSIQKQNLSLTVLFLLVLIAVLIRIFFHSTLNQVFNTCRRKVGKKNKADTRYRSGNLYYGNIKYNDLIQEKKWLEQEFAIVTDESLQKHLEGRLQKINNEIGLRAGTKENPQDKFTGIFSYYVGHNPMHKKYFEAKGLATVASP